MFPINRRHQGLATVGRNRSLLLRGDDCFQSIGVTKDWRPSSYGYGVGSDKARFPINRRHQGLATHYYLRLLRSDRTFPINRRHQGLATSCYSLKVYLPQYWFPINRRHQGLATVAAGMYRRGRRSRCFQSIGVTKDWRQSAVRSGMGPARLLVSNQ